MPSTIARRIRELPPYLFSHIDKLKGEARARGADLIDLGVGDPDLPTPDHVVQALREAAARPAHHRYPSYQGMRAFREAAAAFCQRRFRLDLDPEREVLALIGSKEGIGHLAWALVDPGDVVLVPDPGYPVYSSTARFAGGSVVSLRLTRERGFLPDLESISGDTARRAKLLWISYPHNPTGATATRDFYERVVAFAKDHDVIVASDLAYSELHLEGEPPPSFLEASGAMDVGIEFHSLSKTYNMTGWRIGFAIGRADLVGALGRVKTHVDSGVFETVQAAGVAALAGDQGCVRRMRDIYRERRDALCDGLAKLGYDLCRPTATFYVLCATPPGVTSMDFAAKLLADAAIVATPANGFGPGGEGYVRFALTQPVDRIREAVRRLEPLRR